MGNMQEKVERAGGANRENEKESQGVRMRLETEVGVGTRPLSSTQCEFVSHATSQR